MDDGAGWPLGPDQEQLLGELATLLARGGAWRFRHAPVVAANATDYPDRWEENREGIGRVVTRTMWHAFLDLEAVIEDTREPAARDGKRLRKTVIELVDVDDKQIKLAVSAIGNDDVAGLVSHEIGRAYVAYLSRGGHPFRTAEDGLPELATGSIATVVLGLGVVAANSARYDRSAGEVVGRTAYHEHEVAQAGGLDSRDLAFLLAVQATVRDDVLTALETLRPTQARDVAAWREVLDDHEDELIARLGLAADDDPPATRPAEPPPAIIASVFEETQLTKANYGMRVFRVPESRTTIDTVAGGALGFGAGLVLAIVSAAIIGTGVANLIPLAIPTVAGVVMGWLRGRGKRFFRCASCRGFVTASDAECTACGGRIAGEIAHANDRLAREEELEEAERAARDSATAPD